MHGLVKLAFGVWLSLSVMQIPPAAADLRITDGSGQTVVYSFAELDRLIGAVEREIPDDYLYKQSKRYVGYDLRRLFEVLELPTDRNYLLVCTDGYEIPFDAAWLEDERFAGLLARGDVEADAAQGPWLPYRVGSEPTALSPFYLAWAADAPDAQQAARDLLPWPYALHEIRYHDADELHAAAAPRRQALPAVHSGFEVFTTHCMKCHKINQAGGSLGPELTSSPAVTFTTDAELADVIVHIDRYYPNSKMPVYAGVLSSGQVADTVAYLRHINERLPER
ncbi:MAG: c-type cytochrome [Pseudomonadota bacterium]